MSKVDHIAGHTYHGRRGVIKNDFRYRVDYVMLTPDTACLPSLMKRNKAGLTALYDRDFGGPPGEGRGTQWVRDVLTRYSIDIEPSRIDLLAQPRVLGHVFNPVSFWLIWDPDEALRVVIAEVTNTYSDRHAYLCHNPDLRPITRRDYIKAQKIFHVSPFQPLDGTYRFRFDISNDRVGIWIDYDTPGAGLYATLTGKRRKLTNAAIIMSAIKRPFGSRRVLGLIHWQALKLWWKGARFRNRPTPPEDEVSQ